jgi:hypothetical protein
LDDTACVSPSASMQSTSDLAFTIKEISFSNTVVDVSQMQQQLPQRPPVATSSSDETRSVHADDDDGAVKEEKTAADYLRLIL